MVNVRNVFAFTTMALVAAVSASHEDDHRTLQAVNFRTDLLDAINAARKKEGLDALCINQMLMDAAQIQANDMADNNFIKSTGSDGSVPKTRAADQGFKADTRHLRKILDEPSPDCKGAQWTRSVLESVHNSEDQIHFVWSPDFPRR
ncbi:Hypothetical protein PHPALM_5501 [Phytophthora palmivora]|uniref:SCP domain-containing protein n=1 Tax=Phytophthora palmivora TaxID=4796 RepID=A0A2P4YH75_9STRA|nr:Hypothetical protein PHPALM_5501 [Phytophthora palmivora]